jgi:hypothetical protein
MTIDYQMKAKNNGAPDQEPLISGRQTENQMGLLTPENLG